MGFYTRPDRTGTAAGALRMDAPTHRGSPPLCLPNVVAEGVSELGGPHGSGVPMVALVDHGSVVGVTDPHGLTIGEAGGRREAHRCRLN